MHNYELTKAAEQDLEAILEFGIENFGVNAAIDYYDQLVTKFDELAATPKRFPSREEIRDGYRLCSCRSHDIYFSGAKEVVLIIRILNRQNIDSAIQAALDKDS